MSDAARCRPRAPGRLEVTRATLSSALERAVEVAAALEVRGYASARPGRGGASAWSRHDSRVLAAAFVVICATVACAAGGAAWLHSEPTVRMASGAATYALAAVFALAGALPFAGASARLGVARG
jgi:energy-coupling factor transport system permease protein